MKYALTILDRALTARRPHGDVSTMKFCKFIGNLLPGHTIDDVGNIHYRVGGMSKTLFVAHVDTLHRKGGHNKVIKTDAKWSADGAPLGADDGAGVAVLMHMIKAGVPGYYIFTQGEECGGIGAKHLAKNYPKLLKTFDRAVAFDRRATYSVITHQGWGGRCCSDKFGQAVADALNAQGMLFMPDETGVYTDTAEFTDAIAECTNISVGYDMEHTEREVLDMQHFADLCRAVVRIKWETLPTVRKPGERDYDSVLDYKTPYYDDYRPYYDDAALGKKSRAGRVLDSASADAALMASIKTARSGNKKDLIARIAKVISPESPTMAEHLINPKLITKGFLDTLVESSAILDSASLLEFAFNEIGDMTW